MCQDEPLDTNGAIYYVCDCKAGAVAGCQPGRDESNGRNMASPWRTLSKAQAEFAALRAGDTVAFCRGGAFEGRDEPWFNTSCRAKLPCHIRDYRPPWAAKGAPAPVLRAHLNISNNGNAKHKEGVRVSNLNFQGDGTGVGIVLNNDAKDIFVCNVTVRNYEIGVYVAGGNPPDVGSDGTNARVVLRGSRVLHNKTMGWLGSCDDCRIEYNLFDHNGQATMVDHGIYLNGPNVRLQPDYTVRGMRVVGNEIHRSAAGEGTVCMGAPLVVHGNQDDLLIANNRISEDLGEAEGGCWGISVSANYPRAVGFRRVVISGNTVINVGNASIHLSACEGCRVENNLVIQAQPAFGARGILVARNHPREPTNLIGTAVTVLNNTVFFATSLPGDGISVGSEGRDYVISGNVIVQSGQGALSCFAYDLPSAAYHSDHNVCWSGNSNVASWEVRTKTLPAWRVATGLDLHSTYADPKFVQIAGRQYDLSPANGSPLIHAADPAHSPMVDLLGRRRANPPDVGALEHQ